MGTIKKRIQYFGGGLAAILFTLLLSACSDSNNFDTSTTDDKNETTSVAVASTAPTDGAVDILLDTEVTVNFSEAVDPDTVTASSFALNYDALGTSVVDTLRFANPSTVVLSPDTDLKASSNYTLTLSDTITDLAGNALAPTTTSFKTGTQTSDNNDGTTPPPAVTSTAPTDGVVDVGANVKVVAVFNNPMNSATIDNTSFTLQDKNQATVAGTVSYNPNTLAAELERTTNLTPSTEYTATITTAVQDDAGNALSQDFTWTFTTATPLAVTSTAPIDGAIDVGTDVKVIAVFNNDMKPATIDDTSFTLQGDSESAIVGTVSYNSDTLTAALEPNSDLTASKQYTAAITTAVEDAAGDSLLEDYTWTFTTGTGPDTAAPTINSTSPSDGAINVVLNTKVTVNFSEAIDPDTVTSGSVSLNDDTAGTTVAGSRQFVNPSTVVFSPNADLAANSDHTLTLSGAITDLAGNALAFTTVGFKTGAGASSGPVAVDLGTSGNYVILAKTGISTTGTTDITGDIAVSPESQTALTGFNETLSTDGTFATSPLVTGKLFAASMAVPTPTTLTTAVSDMETAYTDAAGRSDPDFSELGAGEIGGMTLEPGLYKWGTGVLVASDVTLNGDDNDVWIFQVGQDLKLQDGKAIMLSGGAQPKNIFWQVAGDVTLQAGTTFNGVILGKTGIILKSGAVINGRALGQTATTLISNDINEPGL